MPKHAYTNNNYFSQKREEAKQTNVKRETTYWATFQPFPETGEGGWGGGKQRLTVPRGIMNHLFVSHRIFVITCEQISPEGWNADLFALFHYGDRKNKNGKRRGKKKRKENNAFAKGEESKIKFCCFSCLFAVVLFFATRMHLIKVTFCFFFLPGFSNKFIPR